APERGSGHERCSRAPGVPRRWRSPVLAATHRQERGADRLFRTVSSATREQSMSVMYTKRRLGWTTCAVVAITAAAIAQEPRRAEAGVTAEAKEMRSDRFV